MDREILPPQDEQQWWQSVWNHVRPSSEIDYFFYIPLGSEIDYFFYVDPSSEIHYFSTKTSSEIVYGEGVHYFSTKTSSEIVYGEGVFFLQKSMKLKIHYKSTSRPVPQA